MVTYRVMMLSRRNKLLCSLLLLPCIIEIGIVYHKLVDQFILFPVIRDSSISYRNSSASVKEDIVQPERDLKVGNTVGKQKISSLD